jgi:hypothetical protein
MWSTGRMERFLGVRCGWTILSGMRLRLDLLVVRFLSGVHGNEMSVCEWGFFCLAVLSLVRFVELDILLGLSCVL